MKLKLLTIKDVANELGVSLSTAQRYYADIKSHFDIHKPMYEHLYRYFKLI